MSNPLLQLDDVTIRFETPADLRTVSQWAPRAILTPQLAARSCP